MNAEHQLNLAATIDRTVEIVNSCRATLDLGGFPRLTLPEGRSPKDHLLVLAHEGLRRLYGVKDLANPSTKVERQLLERLDAEMSIIERTGSTSYFLLVGDIVNHARQRGIPVGPGRGSAGGSLVAYAIGITTIDPIRFNLVFERLLNPERVSPPNFDIECCQERRGEVIEYVKDKYGADPVVDVEACGLLGMAFFGLQTLTMLKKATELVCQRRGTVIDFARLPLDDRKTYALLRRGDTDGVFELEREGIPELLRELGVDRIEDLIAVIALYRPGPMKMLPSYVARRTGREQVTYDHPLLEPILAETHGVMAYQEQVTRAITALAGYSFGQADILRRTMGKRLPEVMERERSRFVEECHSTNRIPAEEAAYLFERIASFAPYTFLKAHATGYALLAYQCAWMKANYPAEHQAACENRQVTIRSNL